MTKTLVVALLLVVRPGYAAEFEVIDKLAVNGAATLFSSATILVPVTQSASLWASTSAVTPHLFVSTAGNVGLGTSVPGARLEVAGQVKITGGTPGAGKVLTSDGAGLAAWGTAVGDNLGDHVATTTLNMASWNMVGVSSINFRSNVFITSATAAQHGGVYVSTNLFVAGISSATQYYGDGSRLTGVSTDTLKIGDAYGGGIVYWVDPKGRSALISATADQSAGMLWTPTNGFTGAGVDGIGGGRSNTVMITTTTGPGSSPARLCADYAVTVSGVYYDDWYLPSKDELALLYVQRGVVGGFAANWYWSSTEYDTTSAWGVDFNIGSVTAIAKTSSRYVRCVRAGPVSAFDHLRDAETVRDGAYRSSTQTFTGGNTFTRDVTASSFTATGVGFSGAQVKLAGNVMVSSEASAALGGGVRVSTNVYIVGFSSAVKYYGDGSGLTGITGDNLGNHTATQNLNMAGFPVVSVSSISASGVYISTYGEVQTAGVGRGSVAGNARGAGAVDLQVNRSNATEVASGAYSVISGGQQNTGSGLYAVVAGGSQNTAGNQYSSVGGGVGNSAPGDTATVPGGRQNSAAGAYSFSAGFASTSTAAGAFTWSDSQGVGVFNNLQDRAWFKTRGGFLVTGSTNSHMSGTVDRGVFITGGGLVGISTDTPRAALDVVSTGTAANVYAQIWRNSAGTIVSSMTSTGELYPVVPAVDNSKVAKTGDTMTGQLTISGSSLTIIAPDSADSSLWISTSATTPHLYVSTAGYVAIGTTTPSGKLHVSGGNINLDGGQQIVFSSVDTSNNLKLKLWTGYGLGINSGTIFYAGQNHSWRDVNGTNERMSLNTAVNGGLTVKGTGTSSFAGVVGVGTTGPQAKLHVVSTSATDSAIFIASHATAGYGLFVSTNGDVGIGTADPGAKLEVAGQIKITGGAPGAGKVLTSDGAGLAAWGTAVGDNLGDHVATTTLQMGVYGVNTSSSVTAARYQIYGSTVLGAKGTRNIFVGDGAGRLEDASADNAFVGYNTGASIYGARNSILGSEAGYSMTGANESVFLGYQAGYTTTSGEYNVFAGAKAGYLNTTGWKNSFVGAYAGYSNDNSASNSFFGYSSGYANTTGTGNSFVGDSSGLNNNTGYENTFIGTVSGNDNTSGSRNTFVGVGAGYGNTTVSDNSVLGYGAGTYNVTGGSNTIVGKDAGRGQSGNSYAGNSLLGYQAGYVLSTGSNNVFLGWKAGYNVTTGTGNIVIGYNKLTPAVGTNNYLNIGGLIVGDMGVSSVTVKGTLSVDRYQINGSTVLAILGGVASLGIGGDAGKVNTGDYNVFVGTAAGILNTSGSYNLMAGSQAGRKNTLGGRNTFLGSFAGNQNLTGQENSFTGQWSGSENTTGDNNSYLGSWAGMFNHTGSANAIFGSQAGGYKYGAGSGSFSSSTIVGYQAGYKLTTGSGGNIFLGYQAGYEVTTGTGNIIIGYNQGTSAAGASNEINIGGVYRGNISSGTATIPKFTVQAADSGIIITSADFGKTITINDPAAQTVTLPSVTDADIGATLTVVKLGAGNVTITAPSGVYIADSISGGSIYNNLASQTYATISLRLVTSTKWVIMWGDGCWTTN
ncbi:MAG: hypothetical protein A2X28_03655 [Elusimicrobia bacterium GWA2_56_46]|nr:MAG: hypothetical protein A2X28_03655 [Elusimicrobia bacterium GWA2_56_46]OGR54970.1 MAG: hypothetical protein A2X39_02590 [Elusimicrobia bacterium GWC2_56_31]